MTTQDNPPVEMTPEDRQAAWPYAKFHCLPDSQMRERWFDGYYDNLSEGAAIRDFARHRLASQRPAIGDEVERELKWLRDEIISLCEATENDPRLSETSANDLEGKQGAYARGRIVEAKGIRRTIAEVVRVKLAAIAAMQPQAPATVRCVACDDKPAPENNPCVVCGKQAPATGDVGELVDDVYAIAGSAWAQANPGAGVRLSEAAAKLAELQVEVESLRTVTN